MSSYEAKIFWQRGTQVFTDNKYSRAHHWHFSGDTVIDASASHHIVPLPYSVAEYVDPEEAFVASLSSCHMLFVLSIAASKNWLIDSYEDNAIGYLEKNANDKLVMSRVILRPTINYSGHVPSQEEEMAVHHKAHDECFIANSVTTDIKVELPRQ